MIMFICVYPLYMALHVLNRKKQVLVSTWSVCVYLLIALVKHVAAT